MVFFSDPAIVSRPALRGVGEHGLSEHGLLALFRTLSVYSAMLGPQWYMLCVGVGLALGRIPRFSA